MKVSCPSCDAKYNIADDKVQGKKVKVRCKTCGSQILVDGTASRALSDSEKPQDAATVAKAFAPSASAAPASDDTWSVNFSETDERTLSTSEIAEMAAHGQLGAEVFVWKDGMDDWVLVAKVPELVAAIAAAKEKAPVAIRSSAVASAKTTGRSNAPPAAHDTSAAKGAAKKAGDAGAGASAKASASLSSRPPEQAGALKAGPIVAAPGSALAKKLASAKSAAAHKAAGTTDAAHEGHAAIAAGHKLAAGESGLPQSDPEASPAPKVAVEPKAATKLATKRQAGAHDLFAAVDKAGSEIDIDTSEVHEHETTAKTGARNENSVLFSLDALKSGLGAGGSSAPSKQTGSGKKAPAAPGKRLEDLMSVDLPGHAFGAPGGVVGGGLLLSGSGNDALLAAPPPPAPKPEPKRDFAVQASGGLNYAAPPKSRLGLIIGLAAGMLALGAGGAVFALKSSSADTKVAAASASVASIPIVASASAAPKPSASPEVAKTDVAVAAAPAAATGVAAAPAVAAGKVGGHAVASTKSGGETKPSDKKPDSKPSEASAAVASGSFSTDAAKAQLAMMASQSTVCKRPEGPWGTGRAVITFASSGRVTTANVTGEPFGGTAVGGCVANVFRRAKIPPFNGDPVTVSKSFTIAP